ncbi:MAG: PIG-L deacetylase family protein [Planctomycetota bacterium]|jgi:LmbE family N-acetylglucosaminyl deacetylase
MSDKFRITRRELDTSGEPSYANCEIQSGERWLFVSPHDDDAILGAGLWIQAAIDAGARVDVVVVTDGRMGFSSRDEASEVVSKRATEARTAYSTLGVKAGNLHFLGFSDGGLTQEVGSRILDDELMGLEPALCKVFRQLKPTHVLTTDEADWHPDHRVTFDEVRISLFHANGDIWSELGPTLVHLPALYSFPVYSPVKSIELRLKADAHAVTARETALQRFKSQETVVSRLDDSSRCQYLREVSLDGFSAENWSGA